MSQRNNEELEFLKELKPFLTKHVMSDIRETNLFDVDELDKIYKSYGGGESGNIRDLFTKYDITEIRFIEETGGEFDTQELEIILYNPTYDSYYEITGTYYSYHGYEYDEKSISIVYPREVTEIKYFRKNDK